MTDRLRELARELGRSVGAIHESEEILYSALLSERDAALEEAASVDVRGDIETEAEAKNVFQEGYAVGWQDTCYRYGAAIRSLKSKS